MMVECKDCHSVRIVKSGLVRGKQRYGCKECGVHFVEGDARTGDKVVVLKALCVVLYSLGKRSCNLAWEDFWTSSLADLLMDSRGGIAYCGTGD
jgi:transposase-like protein